ncbi:uncharacterized protein [Temnothorax nylanderi]|uniref:uncharacterized protein n=1 Tax=Temnothorax nylanderi TaxID=102681 RepID=UPI003A855BE0
MPRRKIERNSEEEVEFQQQRRERQAENQRRRRQAARAVASSSSDNNLPEIVLEQNSLLWKQKRAERPGPYCFKIQGQIYYQINTALYAAQNENPTYGQLFIVDTNEAVDHRLNQNSHLDLEIVQGFEHLMRECNVFAQSYQMMGEELKNQRQLEIEFGESSPELQLLFTLKPGMDRRRYNAQRTNEVAAVFSTSADGEIPESFVIIRDKHTKILQKVSTMDPNVEPWIYPLFYPYGTRGWHRNLMKLNSDKRITRGQYIKYRMAIRDDFNVFLLGRRLFQQWLVDNYVKIEKDRTDYCKTHQKELRSESYQGLIDYIENMANNLNGRIGKMVILPSTFIGSPRNMLQNYQDAMAIVAKFEIPDPCENRNLHDIVMRHMIHGPCGDWCLVDGKCSKHYPKSYHEETRMDEDAYPYYRRRATGKTFERPGGYIVDNRHVVPYCPTLSTIFNCHINVEIVSSIKSVKYLYKYIYKGHDAAAITIEPITENVIVDHDEIRDYIEARYVGPVEASWRILETCLALGLIEDDDEWIRAMTEAARWMMPRQLRKLFVRILLHCQPLHPEELWESFKVAMSEDYTRCFGILQGQKKAYEQIGAMLSAEGIAATLLPAGKTVHKTFGLPVPLFADSSSAIKIQSKEAQYLKEIDIFIWDEAPMTPRYALDIMDRTLRDIMSNDLPFGGKIVILGGDFRQLLPIKIRDMGDGKLNDSNDNIQIPECCIAPSDADIVTDIYGDLIQKKDFDKVAKCAILSARNIDVDEINKRVVELLDISEERIYTSIDSAVNCGDNDDIEESLLPEYLNISMKDFAMVLD